MKPKVNRDEDPRRGPVTCFYDNTKRLVIPSLIGGVSKLIVFPQVRTGLTSRVNTGKER